LSILQWDRKQDTFARYLDKVEALVIYYDCGDAMDKVAMRACPTKTAYVALDQTTSPGKKKGALFKANKRMCAIITLGQGSDHGLNMMKIMKTPDQPNGVAWEFAQIAAKKNKPKYASAEIQMDNELDNLRFKLAGDFYNDVVSITSRYDIPKMETELVKLMAGKVSNPSYTNMIMDHLNGTNHSLDKICDQIGVIQRLTKVVSQNGTAKARSEKEVQLASAEEGGMFEGVCGNCNKKCGYK